MKIQLRLNVSGEDFFDYLVHALFHDIRRNQVLLEKENIQSGYEYKKELVSQSGKREQALVKITKLTRPVCYEVQIQTEMGIHMISYGCSETEQNQCWVTYTEEYQSDQRLNQWNTSLMGFLFQRSHKKKMKRMLLAMEKHIISERSQNQ